MNAQTFQSFNVIESKSGINVTPFAASQFEGLYKEDIEM
jgi:hypothetical protein